MPGVKALERAQKLRPDRIVIGNDHRVSSGALSRICLKVADNGNSLAAAAKEQSALPGQVVAIDERQHRVAPGARFAHEGKPDIDVDLLQNGDGLIDFFLYQARHGESFHSNSFQTFLTRISSRFGVYLKYQLSAFFFSSFPSE